MKSLLRIIYLPLILFWVLSCKNTPNQNLNVKDFSGIKNINNQRISIDSLETFINQRMNEMNIPGLSLAIINKGKIVYSITKGYTNSQKKQTVDSQTLFEGASISKPIFAYLVMHLVEDGKLELDKPLFEYLNYEYQGINYQDERYTTITARMVLSHSTGFPNWRGESNLEIQFDPGTEFGYSGEGYQYLVKVIESILKTDYKGLEAYFQEKVAAPLGMNHTKFVQDNYNLSHKAEPHKNGKVLPTKKMAEEFNAASAIHSEANEYLKWLIALMNKDGLTEQSYKELFTDQIKTPESEWFTQVGIQNWTLGFAKHKFDFLSNPIYGHIGNNEGFTSLFLIELNTKWGLITFTNEDQADDFGFELFKYLNKKSKYR